MQPQSTGISHKLNMKGPLAVYLLTLFFLLSPADLLNLCLNNDVKMGRMACMTAMSNEAGFGPDPENNSTDVPLERSYPEVFLNETMYTFNLNEAMDESKSNETLDVSKLNESMATLRAQV
ncbi:unnamed protein product [Knipowitschia caucasica]|uniref:Uncharacterized protein n=1 Tax=Knipowitschia caucasica TaxID=637954 RepID=A0AAV2L7U7_KNICA